MKRKRMKEQYIIVELKNEYREWIDDPAFKKWFMYLYNGIKYVYFADSTNVHKRSRFTGHPEYFLHMSSLKAHFEGPRYAIFRHDRNPSMDFIYEIRTLKRGEEFVYML